MLADSPHPVAMRPVAVRSAGRLAGWSLLLTVLALGPIFVFQFPGLQDYPNHLARAFILLHRSDPVLERFYSVQWAAVPNLGWDIWAMEVGRILPLEWTGKLFLALSSASVLFGCFALNRALVGRWTFAPLLAVPFLFNTGFTKGFLNFNLGVGCALLAAACWISIDEKYWGWRLVAGTLFSTLLYLIHFYGWAFYGIFVLGRELQVMLQTRPRPSVWRCLARLARDGSQAIPAIAMMALVASSQRVEMSWQEFYAPDVRIAQIHHLIDVGDVAANCILVLVIALSAIMMFRRGWMRLRSDLAVPLVLCLVLFFILPDRIAGTYYVSWRILLMALLLALASLSFCEKADLRIDRIMSAVTLVTVVIVGVLLWSWRNSQNGREDFLRLIRNLPDGSALFVVHDGMTPRQLTRRAVGLYHVGAYAVLAKRALVQSLFVYPGQQPLRFRDPVLQSIPGNSFTFLTDVTKQFKNAGLDFRTYLQRFDYVVVHGPDAGGETASLPADILTLINRVDDFRLYRVTAKRALN